MGRFKLKVAKLAARMLTEIKQGLCMDQRLRHPWNHRTSAVRVSSAPSLGARLIRLGLTTIPPDIFFLLSNQTARDLASSD